MAPFSSLLFVVVAALPFVLANGMGGSSSSSSQCGESEFYYGDRDCCLPNGGMSNPPSPPQGTQCPGAGWYWHPDQSCCVPTAPLPPSPAPPQCNNGYFWHAPSSCCQPSSTPSSTPSPKPSGKTSSWRRSLKSRKVSVCPDDMMACPLPGLGGANNFECVDVQSDIESCGDCASTGAGMDCTAIVGAWNVGCVAGACTVHTCNEGFTRSLDGQSCLQQ